MTFNFPHILETHLVDHCNLNCKGCSHFAPLVDGEAFADIDVFRRDLKRLSELFHNIYEIRLMGGEPLLHPNLLPFFDSARNAFPRAGIVLFTNGLRLLSMDEVFWESCAKNRILIKITWYPVGLNISKIKTRAGEKNVRIKIPAQIKCFYKNLNIAGDSDPKSSFRNCRIMFNAPQLRDGKIYPCFLPAYIHFFNRHFNTAIYPSEKDSISIWGSTSAADILNFLENPVPMCRWCLHRRPFAEWGVSRTEINEWIGDEENQVSHLIHKIKYGAISIFHESKKRFHR
jgi:hypothetical protein